MEFHFNGRNYTPLEFLGDYLELNPDDYYSFVSTLSFRYGERGELKEADNWWHDDSYFNISVDDYARTVREALKNGFTVCICGDVSEPGYDRYTQVGIVPDFDIPASYINASAREMRLVNKSTSDDHCMHIVGYYQQGDIFWYLLKDSSSGAFDGKHKGYRFIREDYVKLKMMNIMVHKDGARILDKLIK